MKQVLLALFLLLWIPAQSQTIDGFCGFKFGANQNKILKTSWVKGSIVEKKEGKNNLDVFVENVKFNNKVYDACLFQFYKGKLYGGIMVKLLGSQEALLNEIDSIKNIVKIEGKEYKSGNNETFKEYQFNDYNENELLVKGSVENGKYILRLYYGSSKINYQKKKDEEKRRRKNERNEIQIQIAPATT